MKQRGEMLEKMKLLLLAKQQELTDLLGKTNEKEQVSSDVKDSADEASSTVMSRLQSSLQETEVAELKLIEDALVRIDKGIYGICVQCEEPIPERRLEYYPYAARCIACQERYEG